MAWCVSHLDGQNLYKIESYMLANYLRLQQYLQFKQKTAAEATVLYRCNNACYR